jgi:diguanylate cyclase (GGDEF)-like protein
LKKVNSVPKEESGRILAKLHRDFLGILQASQSKLLDLDRNEIHALCLAALSAAGGGAPAILLLAPGSGELALELSSGPLPCPPEKLQLNLSAEDQELLSREPLSLRTIGSFQTMITGAFENQEVFAAALTQKGRVNGALILLVSGDSSPPEQLDYFQLLASQINFLLEYAGVFEALVGQAMLDDHTGLFNHRYLTARLPQEIARASRHVHPLSLVFCDIDDFGAYIQNNGRITGYGLLAKFANMLKARSQQAEPIFSFRSSDIPVRYGLEQFVVLLPETPKEGALTKAERLCRIVESTHFAGGDSQPLGKITLSIGVATFPEDASDAVSLLEAADLALNQARERGKNRVQPA